MTRTDLELCRTYLSRWEAVNDVPLTTPGPDALYKASGEGVRHSEDFIASWRVVESVINEQWKAEKVSPEWMTRLLIHVYRHGYPARSFRLYEDPAKGNIPQGVIALGFDSETIVKARLHLFRVRLLAKIDEQVKLMQEAS